MSPTHQPRVRFAPSPTGYLHVGSARTALFNWLYARSTGGTMVLRIEDTDESRNRPELTQAIFEYLEWLGIDYDEGPLYQSERRERHREAVQQLLGDGRAYLCDADDNEIPGTEMADGRAVRFRTPEGTTVIDDVIRGEVAVDHAQLGDFVIWRSDGSPTFVLANAADDADMAITHAIRGEDLLSSTPRAVLVSEALSATPPIYAHLPLLVNEQRKKLSKRRDDVSLESYQQRGFLAPAMANYLALLGWGPRDGVEIRPMAEIIEQFRLEDVNKAPAFFDRAKLEHFNGVYIRELSPEELLEALTPYLESDQMPWPTERYRPKSSPPWPRSCRRNFAPCRTSSAKWTGCSAPTPPWTRHRGTRQWSGAGPQPRSSTAPSPHWPTAPGTPNQSKTPCSQWARPTASTAPNPRPPSESPSPADQ